MLVNRQYERLFKVRREDVIGQTDHDLFPAEIADEFRANDLEAVNLGVPMQVEEIAPGEDGPHTYVIHYTMTRMGRFFPDHDPFARVVFGSVCVEARGALRRPRPLTILP